VPSGSDPSDEREPFGSISQVKADQKLRGRYLGGGRDDAIKEAEPFHLSPDRLCERLMATPALNRQMALRHEKAIADMQAKQEPAIIAILVSASFLAENAAHAQSILSPRLAMIRLSSVTVPAMSICWEGFPHPLSRTTIAAATRAAGGVFAFPMIDPAPQSRPRRRSWRGLGRRRQRALKRLSVGRLGCRIFPV
jgi:hypothetical protein